MKATHLRLVADSTRHHVARVGVDWHALGRGLVATVATLWAVVTAPFRLVAAVAGLLVDSGRAVVRGFFKLVLACIGFVFVVYPVCMVIFTAVYGAAHHLH